MTTTAAFHLPALYPYYEPPINARDMLHTPDGQFMNPPNSVLHPTTPEPGSDDDEEDEENEEEQHQHQYGAGLHLLEQYGSADQQVSFKAQPEVQHNIPTPPPQHPTSTRARQGMHDPQPISPNLDQRPMSQASNQSFQPQVPTAPAGPPRPRWRVSHYAEKNPDKKRPWKPAEQQPYTATGLPTFAALLKENQRLKAEVLEIERDDKLLEDALLRRRIQRRFQDIDVSQIEDDVLQSLAERLDAEKNLASGDYSDWRNFEGIAEKKYLSQLMSTVTDGAQASTGRKEKKRRQRHRRRRRDSSDEDE